MQVTLVVSLITATYVLEESQSWHELHFLKVSLQVFENIALSNICVLSLERSSEL